MALCAHDPVEFYAHIRSSYLAILTQLLPEKEVYMEIEQLKVHLNSFFADFTEGKPSKEQLQEFLKHNPEYNIN
jgi:hypothetical protein